MNKFKIYLDNFQSISSGELEFTTGQNFIIGQSNSGKTATFRAIKACLLNPKGSQRFIKKGYNRASVTIEYNGNTIEWKRTPKESSYSINGEDYVKTGSSNAFKILEDKTGFTQGLGNSSIMNIEGELDVPFPFDLSGAELFKLFENVFCVSDSAIILKSAKEQEDKTKKDIDNIETETLKNRKKLKAVEDFREEVDLDKLMNYKSWLSNKSIRLTNIQKDLPFIKKVKSLVDSNTEVSSYSIKKDLAVSYDNLKECKKLVVKLKELHKISKSLPQEYIKPENKLEQLKKAKDLQSLVSHLKELNKIRITSEMNFEALKAKKSRYNDLVNLKKYFANLKSKLDSQESRLNAVKNSIEEYKVQLSKYDVCPLCHQPLKN